MKINSDFDDPRFPFYALIHLYCVRGTYVSLALSLPSPICFTLISIANFLPRPGDQSPIPFVYVSQLTFVRFVAIHSFPSDFGFKMSSLSERGGVQIRTVSVLVALCMIAVMLRIFARFKRRVGFGMDDYLCFISLFFMIGMLIELSLCK